MKKLINLFLLCLISFSSPLFAVAREISTTVIDPGFNEQLFLDDYLIDSTENITRRINRAEKHPGGPVLLPDKPWEENMALLFGSVIFDEQENLYKMWYYSGKGNVGYAISRNGLEWEKPALDIVTIDGEKTNLVIERGKMGHLFEICGVLRDDGETDPARRYKLGFVSIQREYAGPHQAPFHPGQRRGLGVAVSPDGLHWRLENDFATDDICDISRFFWDAKINRFVLFGRTKLTPEAEGDRWKSWGWGRAVTRLESRDFGTWSQGELVLAADRDDPEGTEIYSVSVFPYGDIYVGCVQMFQGLPTQGNLDVQLAVSRDGRHFSRVEPRQAFIPEGPVGEWDRFNISLGNLPPIEVGDELWFYYSGRSYRHGPYNGSDTGPHYGAIGLAKIKRGRFLSLEASFDGGTIITKPLLVSGKSLTINANAQYGSIEISLLDETNKPLEGWQATVTGRDSVDIPVSFNNRTLSEIGIKPAKIMFRLMNAQLYGFQIKP